MGTLWGSSTRLHWCRKERGVTVSVCDVGCVGVRVRGGEDVEVQSTTSQSELASASSGLGEKWRRSRKRKWRRDGLRKRRGYSE